MKYPAFFLFVKDYSKSASAENQLNAFDFITLHYVLTRRTERCYRQSVERLLRFGLIKEDGYYKYVLGDGYFSNVAVVKSGDVSAEDVSALYNLTERKGRAAMSDFAELFAGSRTLKQTRLFIQKCVGLGLLTVEGEGRMTRYQMGDVVS